MNVKTLLSSSLALAIGLAVLPASAETFRAATWGVSGSFTDRWLINFADQVREATSGNVDFEVFSGGVLLPPRGTLQGIETGVADVANLTAAYIPAEMPIDAVGGDISFIADDQLALAFAKTEINFTNQQMRAEYEDLGIVFLSSFTVGIYYPICNFNLTSLQDLRGKKVRASSGAHIEFATRFGAVPVSAPATEIYTGLQRKTLDCAFGDAPYLTEQFKLMDVSKSVFQLPLGSNANGGFYANKSFWQDRSPEERRAILKAMSRKSARAMIEYETTVNEAWEAANAAGVALNAPSDTDSAELAALKEEFIAGLAKSSVEKRGIDDPTALVDEFVASIEKWKGLLAEVDRTNLDEVTALLDREIFDKVDVETYGTN